jgi:hypothetical protein
MYTLSPFVSIRVSFVGHTTQLVEAFIEQCQSSFILRALDEIEVSSHHRQALQSDKGGGVRLTDLGGSFDRFTSHVLVIVGDSPAEPILGIVTLRAERLFQTM